MKTSRAILIVLIAALMVVGSACRMNVPGAIPKATATATVEGALPTSPTDVLNQIYVFATQTAMASGQGLPQGTPATPVPGDPSAATPGAPAAPVDTSVATPGLVQPGAPPSAGGAITPVSPSQPTPAVVLPAPTMGPIPATYTLQKGEHPFCIARRFDVDPAELLRLNGLSTYSIVYAGMSLRIPQTGNKFPGSRALMNHPTTYVVGPNDTIYAVACAFGDVDPMAIAYVNGLQPPYKLVSGSTIQIP